MLNEDDAVKANIEVLRKKTLTQIEEIRNYVNYDNHSQVSSIHTNKENPYIAPVPTEISLSLKIQGMAGIHYFDGFLVDKIPSVFERFGIFYVVRMVNEISVETGWTTDIEGQYYFLTTEERAEGYWELADGN